jgi:hypothetical protein
MHTITCWVVTDGKAGMESQCLGLAAALGLTPVVKRVALRSPWRQMTPYVRLFQRHAFASHSDALRPPWPDLLIATGRHSVAASLYVREESRKAGRGTVTVQLQNPAISSDHFDLVVTPRHDRLDGVNVISTKGALHRVNRHLLAEGAETLSALVGELPRPYIGVLVGGSNAAYRLTPKRMTRLAGQLAEAARKLKGSLLITPSRRTDAESLAILKAAAEAVPHFVWDGSGDNPYFGILGLADFIVATADSVNMVSEACATGKPVYVADLPGGSRKFRRFHRMMHKDGMTRPFEGTLEPFYYPPLDDMSAVAERVRMLLQTRR